ncbi:MAG: imidazole glycerol phosphate synthase subunit HisH [Propionibacteriaceae bacterium]|nr:imidazole glycerol phosphate synthase subunit HisH [Propionibacteriaceae bacterium]
MSSVVVLDYGSGNIHSVVRAIEGTGAQVTVSSSTSDACSADGLVVPGVGAFAACMDQLHAIDGDQIIRERVEAGAPILGICVGHQILFSAGVEHGIHAQGVGLFPGIVQALPTARLPHMGWNEVTPGEGSTFLTDIDRFYFVHSYGVLSGEDIPQDAVGSWTNHDGVNLLSAVEYGPVLSTQFHPEKSGRAGLALLQRWVDSLEDS